MAQPAPNALHQYLAVQSIADKELRGILRDAADEAAKQIEVLGAKAGIGAQVRAAQLAIMRRELLKTSATMYQQVHQSLRDQMKFAAGVAAQGEALLDDVMFRAIGVRLPALEAAHVAQARAAVENLYARARAGIPLSTQVYKTHMLSAGLVDRQVNRGIALGRSAKEIAASVKDMISPATPGGVSYAAMRLARTELNTAFKGSQVASVANKPWVEKMKWEISGSHPNPDECDDLAEEDSYGLGAGMFRPIDVPLPPHPNCLCFLTTVTVSRDQFLDSFMRGEYSTYIDQTIYSSGVPTVC